MDNDRSTVAIIPNYNGREFLGPCLDALLEQKPAAPDILVVDNGSTDGSAEFIKKNYPQINFIALEKNSGFGAAVNRGIRETGHKFIALVNNDAKVQPGWLVALERSLEDRPGAGACAPKVLFDTDEKIIDSAGDACTFYGFVYKRGHHERDDGHYDMPEDVFSVSAVATLYRRALFDKIGLFDENFFAYYEDIDLCFRGQLAGFTFCYEPAALALHRYSATSGSQMKLGSEEVYIHLTGTWIKNLPSSLLLRHLPSVAFFHAAILMGVAMARLRRKAKLPRIRIFHFLSAMIRERPNVQKMRRISDKELEQRMSQISVWSAIGSRLIKTLGGK